MNDKLECRGRAVKLYKNKVEIKLIDEDACDGCGVCKMFGSKKTILANSKIEVKIGDIVKIRLNPNANSVRNSILVFIVPLLLFVLSFVFYSRFSSDLNELLGFAFSLIPMVLWYLLLKILDKKLVNNYAEIFEISRSHPQP